MKGIVSQADAINARIKERISPRLYMFCNYEDKCWAISQEGQYRHQILNLYKVMIDTNYVTGRAKAILTNNNSSQWKAARMRIRYDDLQKLTDQISSFRTVEAHNTSKNNGYFQVLDVEKYRQWLFSVIHTEQPLTEDHFKTLNEELEKISIQVEKCVILFLEYVEQARDREKIIERWESTIINKYTQKEDYLYGQMADMYTSLCAARTGESASRRIDKSMMWHNIQIWIMNYYVQPFEKAEEVLVADYHRKEKIVKGVESRNALYDQLQKKKAELEQKKQERLQPIYEWSHLKTVEQLRLKNYCDYFLKVTMPELIKCVLKENPNCSLLPQDLLQTMIYTYMRDLVF